MKLDQIHTGFHIMAKPAGAMCNLKCDYCFYLEKEALFERKPSPIMSDEVLESYVQKYIARNPSPEIEFVWQGGEPTLARLEFFKKVVFFQQKHANGKSVSNALQTNGVLLDETWCEFLKQHGFMVGLSLDGPEEINDYYRTLKSGKGSFDKVMSALARLKQHQIPFNVLVTVSRYSMTHGLDIYRFLKAQGVTHIQFAPLVERKPDTKATSLGLSWAQPPSLGERGYDKVTDFSVEPEGYGDFLIEIFNEWVAKDVGDIHVMNFEWALESWMGLPSTICIFAKQCGKAVVVEHNGDVFSCDHYVYPDYKLGNIVTDNPDELLAQEFSQRFGEQKETRLPTQCRECPALFACNGECPKNRFVTTASGEAGLNYLCKGYLKYFRHVHPYMKMMRKLIESGFSASLIKSVMKNPILAVKKDS